MNSLLFMLVVILEHFLLIFAGFAVGIFCADKKESEERYGLSVKLSTAISVKKPQKANKTEPI